MTIKVHEQAQAPSGGQGTIEYLVIIAIVVVLSLVVVGIVITQTNSSGTVTDTSSEIKNKVGVGGISIVEAVAGEDTNGLFVLKNMSSETIVVTKINVDGVDHNFTLGQLVFGGEKGFKLHDMGICDGTKKSFSVKIYFTSGAGLSKVSDFQTLTIDCTNVVTPSGNFVEEESTEIVDDTVVLSLREGLVGYWPLDEDTLDYSGNGNDCTNHSATQIIGGKVLGGYSFVANGDYLDCGNQLLNNDVKQAQGSLSAWVKIRSLTNELSIFWGKGQYYSAINVSGSGVVGFYADLPGSFYYTDSSISVDDTNWAFVTVTWDASGSKIYVDGNLEKEDSEISIINLNQSGDPGQFYIGGIGDGGYANYGIDGIVDEVALWDHVLTETEVNQLYNNGAGRSLIVQ